MKQIRLHRHLTPENNTHLDEVQRQYKTFTYDCPCGVEMICHTDRKCEPMWAYMEVERKKLGLLEDTKWYSIDI